MILPSKHNRISDCLLNVGAILLNNLKQESTVSMLWDNVHTNQGIVTFERFVLGLDLLFVLGLIRYNQNGLVERTS